MNQAITPVEASEDHQAQADALFRDAENLFSKAYVTELRTRGANIVENGGKGCHIFGHDGNTYLDCSSGKNIYNLGRCHPALSETLKTASQNTDQGNFVAVSEEKALLGERLSRFMPFGLECAIFTVVRGEAMDAACKIARGHTGRSGLVTVDGGSYGGTGFALSLSSVREKRQFGPLIPDVRMIPLNNSAEAKKAIGKKTAAVIVEPVQVENGCRMPDLPFLKELRSLCDTNGALLIIDETHTGFGRCGKRFASEISGIRPDIMILGEALTGGMFPMTAAAFTPEVKRFFDIHPLIHLCTFGGHDVGCRVAINALDIYEFTVPWQNAEEKGDALLRELKTIAVNYPGIRSVEGVGLLIAMAFDTPETARHVCFKAREHGLLLDQGEIAGHTVLFRPPLTLSDGELVDILERMTRVLS